MLSNDGWGGYINEHDVDPSLSVWVCVCVCMCVCVCVWSTLNIVALVIKRGYVKKYHSGSGTNQPIMGQFFPVSKNFQLGKHTLHIRPYYPTILQSILHIAARTIVERSN